MATMMNESYAVEEGEEEEDNISYTSFKTISTVKTSDGEQTKCEEQCNTAFTSYQTISTVRTWNEDDTQAEDSTDSPCVSQSSLISTCRKGATSPDYYSGQSFERSKLDGSLFNLNQMNRTFQVLMDVEEQISGSNCGSCPDPSLKQATDPMVRPRRENLAGRIDALQQLVSPFGKADTASVLMESIGYISFLHGQVEVLLNRKGRGDKELDLKSRGFCLVPIASKSQVYGLKHIERLEALDSNIQRISQEIKRVDELSVLHGSLDQYV